MLLMRSLILQMMLESFKDHDCVRIIYLFILDATDARTVINLCGRLVEIFHSKFEEYIPTSSQLLNHFIQLQSTLLSTYESNTHLFLEELIASLFRTINLFINWLVTFRKWLKENKPDQLETVDLLIVYLINLCILSTTKQVIYLN